MWLDNASDIDMLFYKPYATIISDIAKNKDYNPLTIGVFGLWGAGKSTLLKLIQNDIPSDDPKYVCVQINAWMFEGYEDAKSALMEVLLKELEETKPFEGVKDKIKNLIKRLDFLKIGTRLLSASAPAIASIATGNPIPILLNITHDAPKLAEQIKTAAASMQDFKDDYLKENESTVENVRKFKEEFQQMLTDSNVENVIVLIDDLDRCSPDRIIDTLEAIKLFLSVERTTFIIAADEIVIEYAIKKNYPPVDGSNVEISTEYIEKIIQLPIHIPELSSKDIENYLLLLVTQIYLTSSNFQKLVDKVYQQRLIFRDTRITLAEIKTMITELDGTYLPSEAEFMEVASIIDSIREIISSTLKGNPRQTKRFLNTFITKKKLAQMYYGSEIDMKILAKLLVLQKLNSELFVQLNEWNKEFVTTNDEYFKMYEAVIAGTAGVEYTQWAIPRIKKWLECEPKDLHQYRLDKYFYLTRESLQNAMVDTQKFSKEARQILDDLGTASEGGINAIITAMTKLEAQDIDNIFSGLLPRIETNQLKFFIVKELFVKFSSYQGKIMDAIGKTKQKIVLADTVQLKTMYSIAPTVVKPVLERLKGGMLEDKLFERVVSLEKTKKG